MQANNHTHKKSTRERTELKILRHEAEEMAQKLRVLGALGEDSGLIPSSNMVACKCL